MAWRRFSADDAGDVALAGQVFGEDDVARGDASVPSPTSISARPESEIEYWRRGAQCQSRT
jgi:hypothetical protein